MAQYRGRVGRSSALHPVIGLAVAALIVFIVLALGLPERVAGLGSGNLDRLVAPRTTSTFGKTVHLGGRAERPPLEVAAESPVPVQPLTRAGRAGRGDRLVGIRLDITNVGTSPWRPTTDLEVSVSDARGTTYHPDPRVPRLKGAKLLPARIDLPPRAGLRGVVVFRLPRSAAVSKVSFVVGSGLTRTAEWTSADIGS